MKRHVVTAAALTLALVGCGQAQDSQQPQPVDTVEATPAEPAVYKPGTYQYSANGGTVTMEIPAKDLTTPEVAEIEQLRTGLKAPEVTYILGDIDNRNGAEKLDPSTIYLYDKDGKEHAFETASTYIGDHLTPTMNEDYSYSYPDGSPMTEDQYDKLGAMSTDIYNRHLNLGDPGERSTAVWISEDKVPDEFTNPSVSVGMEKRSLTPAGESAAPATSVAPSPLNGRGNHETDLPGADTPTTAAAYLNTDGQVWSTVGQDPAMLASYEVIEDDYYPTKSDPNVYCAQSSPLVCTDGATMIAVMDAALAPEETAAPLRDQDPYAGMSDEQLAELPVHGMP